jgi:hypothetical protein
MESLNYDMDLDMGNTGETDQLQTQMDHIALSNSSDKSVKGRVESWYKNLTNLV